MSSTLLTRTTAPQVILFFDDCFKQGVVDACEFGNDIEVKEFLTQRKEDWRLCPIGGEDTYDWHMYRYWLYWLARRHHHKSLAESYIFRIRGKNYLWALLPYCMRFYLMGIEEWLSYPNPGRIELFKSKPRFHWDPSCPNKGITRMDFISYLHNFEFEYRKLPDDMKELNDITMGSFVQALYDLTRKYVVRSEEEDI